MNDVLMIFTYDIDAEFEMILILDEMRLRVTVFLGQPGSIDKGSIGGFDVTNPYPPLFVGPYLGMLSRQNFRIEVTIGRSRHCFLVRLSSYAQDIWREWNSDGFRFECAIEGCEVKHGRSLWLSLRPRP